MPARKFAGPVFYGSRKDSFTLEKEMNSLADRLCRAAEALCRARAIPGGFDYIYEDRPDAADRLCDMTGWQHSNQLFFFSRRFDVLWIRCSVTVPEHISSISCADTELRLLTTFQAPMEAFVNGEKVFEENTWVDFKNPELILSQKSKPGSRYTVALRIRPSLGKYHRLPFWMEHIFERVDDVAYELFSFAAELRYIVGMESAAETLPEVMGLLEMPLDKALAGDCNDLTKICRMIPKVRSMLECVRDEAKQRTVHLLGHAHIDMNWLWDMNETVDLIGRDFGTMCDILEETPSFKFSQSQCAAYDIAKKYYPDIYDRMRRHIERFHWDVTAAAWVEHDHNLVSGESIVRQIQYTKSFLKSEFGIVSSVYWCPDNFGHPASLPQILQKSGISYYYFTRCGVDKHPEAGERLTYGVRVSDEPIIRWRGIDGSELLAYNTNYNADYHTSNAIYYSNWMKERGLDNALYVYGTGDHGGGPARRDVKRALKASEHPSTPNIKFSGAGEFFEALKQERLSNIQLVEGALPLVFEGCYTTHSDVKRYNRLCENTLYTAECLLTLAALNGYDYPSEALEQCWKTTLFNQFHDIICGCAQHATYDEAIPALRRNLEKLSEMITGAAGFIKQKAGWVQSDCIMLFNSLPVSRKVLLELPLTRTDIAWIARDEGGEPLETEWAESGLLVHTPEISAMGIASIKLERGTPKKIKGMPPVAYEKEIFTVESQLYHIQISKDTGEIVTLFDKTNARYICRRPQNGWRPQNGCLNRLVYYREAPVGMSAWELGSVMEERILTGGAGAVIEDGALRKVISFSFMVNASTVDQRVIIERDNPAIRIELRVNWDECGDENIGTPCLLTRSVPDIAATEGYFEIPFAAYKAPNQEQVRPGQMFSVISDGSQGFAVLNDCKYAHKVLGNRMELTLIRSGWEPDAASDIGYHRMTYELYPFIGEVPDSDIYTRARSLNIPLVVNADSCEMEDVGEFIVAPEVLSDRVVLSALKISGDGNGYVMRLYEPFGRACSISIRLPKVICQAAVTDLNEEIQNNLVIAEDSTVSVSFAPYEIVTVSFSAYR